MKKYTLTLFFTVLPAAAGAITAEIPAGTVVNGGDVHSIVTQKVFGEANNFTVSGVQQVMNGGTTHNSNIFPYGKQEVLKGGVSYNTGVQYYGVMESTAGPILQASIRTEQSMSTPAATPGTQPSTAAASLFQPGQTPTARFSIPDTSTFPERTKIQPSTAAFRKSAAAASLPAP